LKRKKRRWLKGKIARKRKRRETKGNWILQVSLQEPEVNSPSGRRAVPKERAVREDQDVDVVALVVDAAKRQVH